MERLIATAFFGLVVVTALAADPVKQVKADFADYGSRSFVHYAVPAMSEVQRLPDVYPFDGVANAPVKIFAAKGEYEPGAFEVWGVRDLGKVKFELGEFKQVENVGGGGERETGVVFPATNLDLKLVKCWYQNLNAWFSYFADTGDFKLCPELLVNDEDLIRTDVKTKANYAKIVGTDGKSYERWINPPRFMDSVSVSAGNGRYSVFKPMAPGFADAKTLQPVTIPKNEFRTFFLTAHVTKEIPAGVYKGEILLTRGQETGDKRRENSNIPNSNIQTFGSIPVEVRVADYELPRPKCYLAPERDFYVSMMHYLSLRHIMGWNGGDRALAAKQLPLLIKDMVAHGQDMHLVGPAEPETFYTLDACVAAGMRPDVFGTGFLPWGKDSETRQAMARRIVAEMDRRYGHHNFYVGYGDEPSLGADGVGGFFREYYQFLEEFQRWGWKFSLSGETCVFRKAGYAVDWFNMASSPTSEYEPQLRLWTGQPDARRAWYANQHVGAENPALARRQNGLGSWLAGYDCLNNYAHHLGPYNDDCEDGLYRPMVFFYGTSDGALDTIAWEGFREGIDDMRYATLLQELAMKAKGADDVKARHLAGRVFQYLALLDRASADLDTCRAEMRRYIEELVAVVKPDPVRPLVEPAKKPAEADRLFEAAVRPLETELAKKDPKTYGATLKKLQQTYEAHLRYGELVDRLERLGERMEAARAADRALIFDRAGDLYLAVARDPVQVKKNRDTCAQAAWAAVRTHPEVFDDPGLKALLEPCGPKTNAYLAAIWGQWGRLSGDDLTGVDKQASWVKAYRLAAKAADATGRTYAELSRGAVVHGQRIFAARRDFKSLKEITLRSLANPSLKPNERLADELVLALFGDGAKGDVTARLKAFAAERTNDVSIGVRKEAINRAGVLANEANDEKTVRALRAHLVGLYRPRERKRYTVTFTDRALSGVGDWAGLDVETAYYDRKFGASTELMSTDMTTGGRNVADKAEGKDHAEMKIVANRWGLHFLFTVTTDKVREIEAHRKSGGSFEGYLAPGKNKPYICFMGDDGEGRWRIFNTAYDAIGQRSVDARNPDRVRCMCRTTDAGFESMLSLNWDNFVDDLPQDGKVWDFENLRWGPGDGTWNGMRTIHGRSSWGELVFALTPAERAAILRGAEDRAYFRFRREIEKTQGIDRYEGYARHWRDPVIGDPAFYEAKVKPFVTPLLEVGKVLGENPSDATILRLAENGTLSKWHNVFFEVDRLRRDWLERK